MAAASLITSIRTACRMVELVAWLGRAVAGQGRRAGWRAGEGKLTEVIGVEPCKKVECRPAPAPDLEQEHSTGPGLDIM